MKFPEWNQFLHDFPAANGVEKLEDFCAQMEGLTLFQTIDAAFAATTPHPVPFSILPVGEYKGALIGVDLSIAAVQADTLSLLEFKENGFWAFLSTPGDESSWEEKVGFEAIAELARQAESAGEWSTEASHLSQAMRRPLYTAKDAASIQHLTQRILDLEEAHGAEAHVLRLAKAGLDAEAWRLVGAERAIAAKTRDGLVCLSAAHFLGAQLDRIQLPVSQIYSRAAWRWGNHTLKFHKRCEKAR